LSYNVLRIINGVAGLAFWCQSYGKVWYSKNIVFINEKTVPKIYINLWLIL
jgi:hypothetical protein